MPYWGSRKMPQHGKSEQPTESWLSSTMKLVAKIPAGVREGQRIRLAGMGHEGKAGAHPATCSWKFACAGRPWKESRPGLHECPDDDFAGRPRSARACPFGYASATRVGPCHHTDMVAKSIQKYSFAGLGTPFSYPVMPL